jgi:hypothetical protein
MSERTRYVPPHKRNRQSENTFEEKKHKPRTHKNDQKKDHNHDNDNDNYVEYVPKQEINIDSVKEFPTLGEQNKTIIIPVHVSVKQTYEKSKYDNLWIDDDDDDGDDDKNKNNKWNSVDIVSKYKKKNIEPDELDEPEKEINMGQYIFTVNLPTRNQKIESAQSSDSSVMGLSSLEEYNDECDFEEWKQQFEKNISDGIIDSHDDDIAEDENW